MSPLEQDAAIKPVVAWKVDDGEHARVVFHHHGLAARREGANELDADFECVACSRAPQFDQYASMGKVPSQALLDAGWWFYCQHCDAIVTQREQDDEERGDPVLEDEVVYCSQACKDKQEATRAERDAAFARFQEEVTTLRPDLVFTHWSGGYPMVTLYGCFRFEGGLWAGTVRDNEDGKGLCWSVCQEDTLAWATYEASREPS